MRKSHHKNRPSLLIAGLLALIATVYQAKASDFTVDLVTIEDKKQSLLPWKAPIPLRLGYGYQVQSPN